MKQPPVRWQQAATASPSSRGASTASLPSPTSSATARPERLQENLGAAALTLTPDDLAELDGVSAAIEVRGERYPEQMQRMIDR